MNAETFINSKLTLQERATSLLVNCEMIYKLMEEYAEIKVAEEKQLQEDHLYAIADSN